MPEEGQWVNTREWNPEYRVVIPGSGEASGVRGEGSSRGGNPRGSQRGNSGGNPRGRNNSRGGAVEAMVAATGVTITPIMTTLKGIIVIMTTTGQSKIGAQRAQG